MSHITKSYILVLTVFFGLGFAFYGFLMTESADPEIAVRKYVFLQRHPLDALRIQVTGTGIYNMRSGHQFFVQGYSDKGTEIKFIYLKQRSNGWVVNTTVKSP